MNFARNICVGFFCILLATGPRVSLGEGAMDDIVFLGDSYIYFCAWDNLFDNSKIHNEGIVGHKTTDILKRLDDTLALTPSKIFIMVGMNDNPSRDNNGQIHKNYDQILKRISAVLPNTQVYVFSLLPIYYELFQKNFSVRIKNEDTVLLNSALKTLAQEYNAQYIDLYSSFVKDGQLDKALTTDGLHLNEKGYLLWKALIQDEVFSLGE